MESATILRGGLVRIACMYVSLLPERLNLELDGGNLPAKRFRTYCNAARANCFRFANSVSYLRKRERSQNAKFSSNSDRSIACMGWGVGFSFRFQLNRYL